MVLIPSPSCIRRTACAIVTATLACVCFPVVAQPLSGAIFTMDAHGSVVNGHSTTEAYVLSLRTFGPPPIDGLVKRSHVGVVLEVKGADGTPLTCDGPVACTGSAALSVPASGFLKILLTANVDPAFPDEADLVVALPDGSDVTLGTVPVDGLGRVDYVYRIVGAGDDPGPAAGLIETRWWLVDRNTGETRAAIAIPAYQDYTGRSRVTE